MAMGVHCPMGDIADLLHYRLQACYESHPLVCASGPNQPHAGTLLEMSLLGVKPGHVILLLLHTNTGVS